MGKEYFIIDKENRPIITGKLRKLRRGVRSFRQNSGGKIGLIGYKKGTLMVILYMAEKKNRSKTRLVFEQM
jgi:hypothetical protein